MMLRKSKEITHDALFNGTKLLISGKISNPQGDKLEFTREKFEKMIWHFHVNDMTFSWSDDYSMFTKTCTHFIH